MYISKDRPDYRERRLVSLQETKERFAVMTTPRDARWRNVPANVKVINRARALELQASAR